ncbi:hypothetical protein DPSP01_011186 [Paraphaeosphaeria sporulosa]
MFSLMPGGGVVPTLYDTTASLKSKGLSGRGTPDKSKARKSSNDGPSSKTVRESGIFSLLRDIPVFQMVLWTSSQLQAGVAKSPWQLQALNTVTWVGTSGPFINFCHSAWSVVGETNNLMSSSKSFLPQRYDPSPWGPAGAVIEHGLAGAQTYPTPHKV